MNRTFAFEVSFVGRLCKNLRTLRNSGELNRRKSVIGRSWKTMVSQVLWRQVKTSLWWDVSTSSFFICSFTHSSQYCFSGLLISVYYFVPKDFLLWILCTVICWILFTMLSGFFALVVDDAFRHWWRPCWRPWSIFTEMPLGSMLTSMIRFAAWDSIDIHDQVLLPEAVLMSIIHTATGNHIEVLFSLLLLLGGILMSVIFSAPGNHVDVHDPCCCWL